MQRIVDAIERGDDHVRSSALQVIERSTDLRTHAARRKMPLGVERVALDFGKPTQRALDRLTVQEARRHLADGQFPPGSMGPKIGAALDYLERGGSHVIITALDRIHDALHGTAGTRIVP